jgi:hypothetical protein
MTPVTSPELSQLTYTFTTHHKFEVGTLTNKRASNVKNLNE